jgi:hypothetical protein
MPKNINWGPIAVEPSANRELRRHHCKILQRNKQRSAFLKISIKERSSFLAPGSRYFEIT